MVELIILGIIAYLVDRFVPMQEAFKVVFRIVCVAVAILLLLSIFGYSYHSITLR